MAGPVHFISGLPRSGSTLLCALLRQNPRFAAAITSPVYSLVSALLPKMSGSSEFSTLFDDARRRCVLRSVFDGYYANPPATHPVVFDTNRMWTGRLALLAELYPEARVICCAREVGWIIDSIERMLRKNPLQLSRMLNFTPGTSIYGRSEMLMNSDTGVVGVAWSALREAWFSELARKLIVVDYERLVRDPHRVLARLYEELGEPGFAHDSNQAAYDAPEYDAAIGMPGLHTVRDKVEWRKREPCIPPELFAKYAGADFWRKPELNQRGAVIL